ncbi:MAG TPA: hypothetical protein VLV86_21785, partial [Vicinamibacterales bacterium]|nr:hypothetical protein [Vicinamibacterales bacterium]
MFKFLFKYSPSTFARGHVVLLTTWPAWMLWVSIAAASAVLALVIRARLPRADFGSRTVRATGIWLLQSLLAAVVLLVLWQPALTITEL